MAEFFCVNFKMADKRTSFKQLLKVQATPEAGGALGKLKEHKERLQDLRKQTAGSKRPIDEPLASLPPRRAAPSDGGGALSGFIPAVAFAGARPGYLFKRGEAGTGYYRDPAQPVPSVPASVAGEVLPAGFFDAALAQPLDAAPPPDDGGGGGGATSVAGVPANFFDNPREDPANAHKRAHVSETQRGEQLRQELASFEKAIESEVANAHEVDELEDEADAEFRAAADDRDQELFALRMRELRSRAERTRAADSAQRVGIAQQRTAAAAVDDSLSDLESGDDDAGLLVDWRSKARA